MNSYLRKQKPNNKAETKSLSDYQSEILIIIFHPVIGRMGVCICMSFQVQVRELRTLGQVRTGRDKGEEEEREVFVFLTWNKLYMFYMKRKLKFRIKCYIIKGSLMLSCWFTHYSKYYLYTENESGWVHFKKILVLNLRGTNIGLILISDVWNSHHWSIYTWLSIFTHWPTHSLTY